MKQRGNPFSCDAIIPTFRPKYKKREVKKKKMSKIKYPDIKVQLTGLNGNIFNLLGAVTKAMRRAGIAHEEINKMRDQVLGCVAYQEAIDTLARWVEIS